MKKIQPLAKKWPKQLPPIIAILGPTASGKSALAFELAQQYSAEIVCVDAVTVYQDLDVGSAKPTPSERAAVPHHMLDCVKPFEIYTVNQFVDDAISIILNRIEAGKPLILVGGTFLYFKGLIEGLSPLPEACPKFRAELQQQKSQLGLNALYKRLQLCDPLRAKTLHPNDTHRIFRALEVFHLTQRPMSQLLQKRSSQYSLINYPNFHSFALIPDNPEALKKRIQHRFWQMIEAGFIEEVEGLFKHKAIGSSLPSLRSLGYRQLGNYCLGLASKEEACQKALSATQAFAKRQMTWLRQWPYPLHSLNMGPIANSLDRIRAILPNS